MKDQECAGKAKESLTRHPEKAIYESLAERASEYSSLSIREGQDYPVEVHYDSAGWTIQIHDSEYEIGRAYCTVRESNRKLQLKIENLEILDDVPATDCQKHGVGSTASHTPRKNCRGRGLGTALLRFVVEHARAQGASEIIGDLRLVDLSGELDLPDWYRRRGFEVTMAEDQRSGRISKQLGAVKQGQTELALQREPPGSLGAQG
jgi:hypothetical protein